MEYKEVVEATPVMSDVAGDYQFVAYYTSKRKFIVVVKQISTGDTKQKELDSNFEPIFGVDVSDRDNILMWAEALCEDFENENNTIKQDQVEEGSTGCLGGDSDSTKSIESPREENPGETS